MPAFSVIIPMYNTEKYIGECLDSILDQTFTNFEVIVVDDCSTDNSVGEVKKLTPHFDGRLKLLSTEKNSGGAGLPRNLGLTLACGEYIFFADSDDTVTPTALEDLYLIAKNFDADVVHCEKFYQVPNGLWNQPNLRKDLEPRTYQNGKLVEEPTLITTSLAERVNQFSNREFLFSVVAKLIRRTLITDNKIFFPNISMAEDVIFVACLICLAEKYVKVPNIINFYRVDDTNITYNGEAFFNFFAKYIRVLTVGFKYLDDFLSKLNFFKQNMEFKYIMLDAYVREIVGYLNDMYERFPAYIFDETLRKEFIGNNVALMAYLFNMSNVYRLEILRLQGRVADFEKTAREDKAYISELENFIANRLDKE